MENIRMMRQAAGSFAILILGIGMAFLFDVRQVPIFLFFVGVWLFIAMCLFLKLFAHSGSILHVVMYLLIAATFVNQSILNIHIGFFSLFLYRLFLIGAWLIFMVHMSKEDNLLESWKQIRVKGLLLFLLGWLAYGTISLLWAASIIEGIKYLFLLGMGISFVYLATFTFNKVKQLLVFYGIWIGMTAVLLMIGFVNHFAHIQLPSSTLYGGPAYKLAYPTAVFTNQNDFATFLTISFFFYLAVAKNSKRLFLRSLTLVLAILSLYTIYLTASRASLLGVLAGLFVYLLILLPPRARKIAGITAAIVLLLGFILLSGRLIDKFQSLVMIITQHSTGANLNSNMVRVHLFLNGLYYLAQTYGLGVGAGNIPYYLEHEAVYSTNHVYQIHNWLLEIMGNFGVIIGLLYFTMYAYLFINLYRSYQVQKHPEHKILHEGCMMALIAFLVSSISPSSVSNLYFHWVFLGLVIAAVSVTKNQALKISNK